MNTKASDMFASYHPVVLLFHMLLVLAVSMLSLHPLVLACSLLGALLYTAYLAGWRELRGTLVLVAGITILSALANSLFNSTGSSVLFTLPWGASFTLEALLFGSSTGLVLGCVIAWFGCYKYVMTSSKIMYLFGGILPSLSLIFTMVLGFIPRFIAQYHRIERSQSGIGMGVQNGGLTARLHHVFVITSIMTTWALEGSLQTADSMRSRGYGIGKRSHYAPYRFCGRDAVMLCAMLILSLFVLFGLSTGVFDVCWYPHIMLPAFTPAAAASFVAWAVLLFLPVLIDCVGELRWRALKLTI